MSGGLISGSDFYAIMPGDNKTTVAPGSSVQLPRDGPSFGSISRNTTSQFILPDIGIYKVDFQVSVLEPGQLVLVINTNEVPYTVVGRATGTTQIIGMCLIKTTLINSTLSLNNPIASLTALTVTVLAGGQNPVSAHLVINRVN